MTEIHGLTPVAYLDVVCVENWTLRDRDGCTLAAAVMSHQGLLDLLSDNYDF